MKEKSIHKSLMALILAFLMVFTAAMPVLASDGDESGEYENSNESSEYEYEGEDYEDENKDEQPEYEEAVAANFLFPISQSATSSASNVFVAAEIVANLGITADTSIESEWTDGFFTVVGDLGANNNARWRPAGGGVLEVGRNGVGGLQFTTTGTSTVTLGASSTGGTNTSAVTIWDADGNAMTELTGRTTVTGTSAVEFVFENLPAGTYRVVSNDAQEGGGHGRGVRINSVIVEISAEATVTDTFISAEIVANLGITADTSIESEWTDGFFTVVGDLGANNNARWRPAGGGVLEVGRNGVGGLQFTTTGASTVTLGASSTGGTNTSAVTIWDADGNAMTELTGRTTVTGTSAVEFVFENLPAGTYRVVSNDAQEGGGHGRGVRINTVKVVQQTSGRPPVEQPETLTATVGVSEQVILNWSAVPLAEWYVVSWREYPNGSAIDTVLVDRGTTFTVTGLTNGVEYEFSVRAANNDGIGPSTTLTATPEDDPRVLQDLRYGAWFETVYATWTAAPDDTGFTVLVSPAGANAFVPVDEPLVRVTDSARSTWRVDVPGLAALSGEQYDLRIIASPSGIINTIQNLAPMPFDRQGYAFASNNGRDATTGGYNADGSIPENAVIIYVTHENMNEVFIPAQWPTAGGGSTSAMIARGAPLIIRVIGQVGTLRHVGDRAGIPLAANNDNHFLTLRNSQNVTIEGIGPDAVIYGWGFQIHGSSNVVVRNLTFDMYFEDAIGIHANNDHSNSHYWVHHNTIRYGQDRYTYLGHDSDMRFGDGGVDVTNWGGNFTLSYNRFFGTDKSMLLGNNVNDELRYGTVHHNWFYRSNSRLPRVRLGHVHVFNNLYENVSSYAIGAGHMANIIAEGNTFVNVTRPFIISGQGHANNFAPPGSGDRGNSLSNDYPGAIITSLVANSASLAGRTLQPNVLDAFSLETFSETHDIGASSHADNTIGSWTFAPFSPAVGTTLSDIVGVEEPALAAERVRTYSGPIGAVPPLVEPRAPQITHLSINDEARAGLEGQHVVIEEGSFVISWTGDVLAREFVIEWDQGRNAWQEVVTIPQSPRPNTFITERQIATPGGTYQFRVTAVNEQGRQTSPVASITYAVPNPPTDLLTDIHDGGLRIRWTPPTADPVPADFEVRVTMIETELGVPITGVAPVIVVTTYAETIIMNLPVGLFSIEVRSRVGTTQSIPLTGEYRTQPWRINTSDLSEVVWEENFRTWNRGRITQEQTEMLGISVISNQPASPQPNVNWLPAPVNGIPLHDPENINHNDRRLDNHRHDVLVDEFGLKLYNSARGQLAPDQFGNHLFIELDPVRTGRVIVDVDLRITRSSTMSGMVPIRLYSAEGQLFASRTVANTFSDFPMGQEHAWNNPPSALINVQIVICFEENIYDFIVNGEARGLGADLGFGTPLPTGITSLGWVSAGTATGNASGHAYSEMSLTYERISVRKEGNLIVPEVQQGGVNFEVPGTVTATVGTTAALSVEVQPEVLYSVMQAEWLRDGRPVTRGNMNIRPLVGGGYVVELIVPNSAVADSGNYTLSVTLLNERGQPIWRDVSSAVGLNVTAPPPPGGEVVDGGESTLPPPPQPPTTDGGDDDEDDDYIDEPDVPLAPPPRFTDVGEQHWAQDYIEAIAERGIMQGVAPNVFAPETTLNRAMVATILWRLAGEPSTQFNPEFTDVRAGEWYSEAITWGSENGILRGIGENLFAPNGELTREQFAALMFRFAQFMEIDTDVPETHTLGAFADYANISEWAVEYMRWAHYVGLITGIDAQTLLPGGTATRAQTATVLYRFMAILDSE